MDIIARLIEQLAADDEVVRLQAGEMLLQMGAAAVRPLVDALQNPRNPARPLIASTLGQIGDKRAVEPLIHALQDQDKLVRLHAALALGKLKDQRAIQPLIHALFDEMPPVGTDPLTGEPLTVRAAAAQALGELQASEAVPAFKVLLQDSNRSIRRAAIQALGQIGTEDALTLLQQAVLRESDELLCKLAIRTVARMSSPKAIEVLRAIALQHPEASVRVMAEEQEREMHAAETPIGFPLPSLSSPAQAPSVRSLFLPLWGWTVLVIIGAWALVVGWQWNRWLTALVAVGLAVLLPLGLWRRRRRHPAPPPTSLDQEPLLPSSQSRNETP